MRTIILNVSGMSCQACVDMLSQQLRALDGVGDVKVDLDSHTAWVDQDEEICLPSEIVAAVRRAGFQVDEYHLAQA